MENQTNCDNLSLTSQDQGQVHLITSNLDLLVAFSVICSVLAVFTVFANIIITVALVRSLLLDRHQTNDNNHSMTKVLMASMAVSDAILGVLVMPFGVYNLITNGRWDQGDLLCKTISSMDVFLSTVSINHVVLMAVERYIAICKPFLYQTLTSRVGYLMIGVGWAIPLLISGLTAIDRQSLKSDSTATCTYNVHEVCQVRFSSYSMLIPIVMVAFYIPLLVIHILYFLVLIEVYHFHRRKSVWLGYSGGHSANVSSSRRNNANTFPIVEISLHYASSSLHIAEKVQRLPDSYTNDIQVTSQTNGGHTDTDSRSRSTHPQNVASQTNSNSRSRSTQPQNVASHTDANSRSGSRQSYNLTSQSNSTSRSNNCRFHVASTRNLRAIKTIGCIVVCFTVCWLPFAIHEIVAFTEHYSVPHWVFLSTTWLGYLNSALNPIIYCSNKVVKAAVSDLMCLYKRT